MTPSELFYLRLVAIVLIVFSILIKFLFWRKAKQDEIGVSGLFSQFFRWYSLYQIYDSYNVELKSFMKINNNTNKVLWLGLAILLASFFF